MKRSGKTRREKDEEKDGKEVEWIGGREREKRGRK